MPVSEDDMIVKTEDFFVTKNTLNPLATPTEVAAFLRRNKTGGQLTTTTHMGGVRSYLVAENKLLNDEESNDCRRVLGMDYEIEDDEEESL
jgi:hypothetical protein